jgi:DNA-binding transcriptional LysR family regulator
MDLRGLDLNLLVVLDALFAERHVTKAGDRIHLSQSATSSALARLRDYFQDDLLVQNGRRMMLTPYAERLVQPVRDLLLCAESLAQRHSAFNPSTVKRTFVLKMSDYVASILMPRIIPTVRALAPGITLDIRSNYLGAVESLERGDVDLLLMPQQFLSKHHPSEVLFEDGYLCVVWSGNQRVGNSLTLDEYLSLGHVAVQYAEMQLPVLEDWFSTHFAKRRRIEVLSMAFTLLPHLIIGTDLVATMHARLARKFEKSLPLRLLPPPVEMPRLVECVQWHTHKSLDPAVRWVRSLLAQAVATPRGPKESQSSQKGESRRQSGRRSG